MHFLLVLATFFNVDAKTKDPLCIDIPTKERCEELAILQNMSLTLLNRKYRPHGCFREDTSLHWNSELSTVLHTEKSQPICDPNFCHLPCTQNETVESYDFRCNSRHMELQGKKVRCFAGDVKSRPVGKKCGVDGFKCECNPETCDNNWQAQLISSRNASLFASRCENIHTVVAGSVVRCHAKLDKIQEGELCTDKKCVCTDHQASGMDRLVAGALTSSQAPDAHWEMSPISLNGRQCKILASKWNSVFVCKKLCVNSPWCNAFNYHWFYGCVLLHCNDPFTEPYAPDDNYWGYRFIGKNGELPVPKVSISQASRSFVRCNTTDELGAFSHATDCAHACAARTGCTYVTYGQGKCYSQVLDGQCKGVWGLYSSFRITRSGQPNAVAAATAPASVRTTRTQNPPAPLTLAKKPSPTLTVAKKPSPTSTVAKKPSPTTTVAKKPSPTTTVAKKPSPTTTVAKNASPTTTVAKKPSPTLRVATTPSPTLTVATTPSPTLAVSTTTQAKASQASHNEDLLPSATDFSGVILAPVPTVTTPATTSTESSTTHAQVGDAAGFSGTWIALIVCAVLTVVAGLSYIVASWLVNRGSADAESAWGADSVA